MSDSRYRVVLTKQAQKDLRKIRHDLNQALDAIAKLETDALAGHTLKIDLGDCRSLEFNLKGSGAYRAVYIVDDNLVVCLGFVIAAHENIYDEVRRRVSSARAFLEDF